MHINKKIKLTLFAEEFLINTYALSYLPFLWLKEKEALFEGTLRKMEK